MSNLPTVLSTLVQATSRTAVRCQHSVGISPSILQSRWFLSLLRRRTRPRSNGLLNTSAGDIYARNAQSDPTLFAMEGKETAEIPTPTTGYSAPSGDRPLGVTILAVLEIIVAILYLFSGISFILLGAVIPYLVGLGIIFGGVFIVFGILYFILGWGLWSLKSWAWMAALILNIIGLILAIIGSDWISVIINLIIILYLQQGEIKSRFR